MDKIINVASLSLAKKGPVRGILSIYDSVQVETRFIGNHPRLKFIRVTRDFTAQIPNIFNLILTFEPDVIVFEFTDYDRESHDLISIISSRFPGPFLGV